MPHSYMQSRYSIFILFSTTAITKTVWTWHSLPIKMLVYWAQQQYLMPLWDFTCLGQCLAHRNSSISIRWIHEDNINLVWLVDQEPFEKLYSSVGIPNEFMHKDSTIQDTTLLSPKLKYVFVNFYYEDICIHGIHVAFSNLK